jgi:hypothetical protein
MHFMKNQHVNNLKILIITKIVVNSPNNAHIGLRMFVHDNVARVDLKRFYCLDQRCVLVQECGNDFYEMPY